MRVLQNYINGDFVPAETNEYFEVLNPATEEVIASSPVSTDADVDRAYAAASAAFAGEWGATTPQDRSNALWRIAAEMERRAADFADAESLDCGKPRATIIADEIMQSVDQIRFFAGAARNLEGKGAGEYLAGHTSYVRREPIGVVGQITPWNYPLNMAVWKIGPALAAGNTIVLKPASTTPLSTLLLAEVAGQFLPAGVLNVVLGSRVTGAAMTDHPTPELVAITGSVRAGMEVAKSAIETMKRTHLELGGKAPAVVFADANIEQAAEGIASAAFFNGGQDCTAATRVIVHESVHDEFIAAIKAHVEANVTTGAPDQGAFYGPMNNDRQYASVLGMLERLPEHAVVVTGGKAKDGAGYFIEPTIVDNMRQDDEAVQEEIFGPVLTVQTFSTEAEALALANGVRYALAASVWTTDHGTAMRQAKMLDFGCVWVNTHIPFVSEMPHGGFKYSGYGKDLSMYGFEDYTRIKHVMHFLGE
ncbi:MULTISPECIES: gamma-aminobutyraldehyde dehydrogenase [unclassified Leucobacter]|uniref:gamma-aminobutyraldehyde dehydrogenase n=1 Tax=unclassified Leucobacter TaxID=2621730 RepID=UPI00165DD9A1|nr:MULTISPECIES: gamma-aminobutyraldehyde dehydrogenase [unclassified Leucobacter]MBC9926028.1 gamma-aminobutyraldehyde dehydrogenase [Leucobacter sp. cx-169]